MPGAASLAPHVGRQFGAPAPLTRSGKGRHGKTALMFPFQALTTSTFLLILAFLFVFFSIRQVLPSELAISLKKTKN